MTKNNVFVGKGYCDQGLFVLNISEIMNESEYSAYIFDSYDIWHARLGHVNSSYVMKLQRLGLINMHDKEVGIKQVFASVEHPQTNGQVESANRVLLRGLKRRLEKAKGA